MRAEAEQKRAAFDRHRFKRQADLRAVRLLQRILLQPIFQKTDGRIAVKIPQGRNLNEKQIQNTNSPLDKWDFGVIMNI